MTLGLLPGLSTGDEIDAIAVIVLAVTAVAVFAYAVAAFWQARATRDLAVAALQPVILVWPEGNEPPGTSCRFLYRNIGSGPALNLRFVSSVGNWRQHYHRVGMGISEENGLIDLQYSNLTSGFTVQVTYEDVSKVLWQTTLSMEIVAGRLRHGNSEFSSVWGRA